MQEHVPKRLQKCRKQTMKFKKGQYGVFRITGKKSNEDYSYGGAFNTSQKNKTGSITIKMELLQIKKVFYTFLPTPVINVQLYKSITYCFCCYMV